MLSMLTLLPAALVAGGRRAFWPFVPRFGSEGTDETHGTWRRVGERVAATPRRVWITTVLLLGLGCLGLTSFSTGLTNISSSGSVTARSSSAILSFGAALGISSALPG